jgi:small GTP-binding protein
MMSRSSGERGGTKVILIGSASTGKSTLVYRATHENEAADDLPKAEATIGVAFALKRVGNVALSLWDTSGSERYRAVTRNFHRGSKAALLVFDVTEAESLQEVEDYWLAEVVNNAGTGCHLVLVGNKIDLKEQRQVSADRANGLALRQGLQYFEVCARDGTGVAELFEHVAANVSNPFETMSSAGDAASNDDIIRVEHGASTNAAAASSNDDDCAC